MTDGLIKLPQIHEENRIWVSEKSFDEGFCFHPHWHDYYEIEIIIDGGGKHTYNNTESICSKGSAYILSYCDYHSYELEAGTSLINLSFDERLLSRELAQFISLGISKCNCVFSPAELDEVKSLALQIKAELKKENTFGKDMISSLLTNIIIRIIRNSATSISENVPTLIQKAVSYIYRNFRTEISLAETAEKLYVSANYLGVKFKNSTGMSFNTYLNMIRLRYCCNLLLGTDLSIKEIAYSGGYKSAEYFMYVFKSTFNITPTEYRNKKHSSE